jgi:hypothetical protein
VQANKRLALTLTVGAGALGLLLWGWSARSRPGPPAVGVATTDSLACRMRIGDQLAFDLHSVSTMSGNPAGPGVDLAALMHWRVVAARGTGWLVAAALDEVRLQSPTVVQSEDLEEPFLIDLGRDCRFKALAFGDRIAAGARSQIEALMGSLEVVLPALPVQKWTARQRDSAGEYVGHYELVGPARAISRRRTGYFGSSAIAASPLGGGPQMKIVRSEAQVTLASQGRWLATLVSDDLLDLALGDRKVAQARLRIELHQIDRPAPARLHDMADAALARFVWGAPAAPRPVRPTPRAPDAVLAALDLSGALADFQRRLGHGKAGLDDAVEALAGYLARRPLAITQLMEKLRAGSVDAKLRSPLFLALELTGTAQAEHALAAAIADRGFAEVDRMRAAVALADVAHPSQRAFDALVAGAGQTGDVDVASTSLLALGTLGHNAAISQPALAARVHDELSAGLGRGGSNSTVAATLDAVGNTGDPTLFAAVAPYAAHASPQVRAHAAGAYRRSSGAADPAGEAALLAWMQREPEASVRRAIVATLVERAHTGGGTLSPPLLATVIERLPMEADAQARSGLIALLGGVANQIPAAKQALVAQFHRETEVRLQQQIGQFCSADDLG